MRPRSKAWDEPDSGRTEWVCVEHSWRVEQDGPDGTWIEEVCEECGEVRVA